MTEVATKQLPTYDEIKLVDPVLLAIAHRYKTLMHSYDLAAFSTIHHPALDAYEQRKISTYHTDAQAALMKELASVLDDIVNRCIDLTVDGMMQPMKDNRKMWTKIKDFVKCIIFQLPPPIPVRVREGVRLELDRRADPDWAE